jgi:hypothetical protein
LSTAEVPACQRQSDLGSVNGGGAVSADVTVTAPKALPPGMSTGTVVAHGPVLFCAAGKFAQLASRS